MEHFPLVTPCLFDTVPTTAGIPELRGQSLRGLAFVSCPRSGYLTFCDRVPADGVVDPECNSIILVPEELQEPLRAVFPAATLVPVADPRSLFIDTAAWLQRAGRVLPSSLLPPTPRLSESAEIEEGVVIQAGVCIDDGVIVRSGAVIRSGTWVRAGAVVGENTVVGCTGINAYLGMDGVRRGFPHLAGVVIGEGVSVGASCVVVRGILSSTVIGAGSTIGNLCNVGHGVEIGSDVWVSAGTAIGGHTKVGAKATIAVGCTVKDNVRLGSGCNVGMGSVVTKDVAAGGSVFGNPAKHIPGVSAGPVR
jgi:UDP-3-O-[3-hydroxymyristoyl] glucosamine N-acyltransferase